MEQRLGRGLDSLIAKTVQSEAGGGPQQLPLSEIRVNPKQPRRSIDDEGLEGLAVSIENHGLLQPVVVRRVDGGYELVAGERRFRATRIAGKTTIPATIVDAEGIRSLELALIENIQRENLSALDEAAAYQQLVLNTGVTHQELASRVGKSRAAVTNALRLLELPEAIRDLLSTGELSAGQARALLGSENPKEMKLLAGQAVNERWSVRQVEDAVRGGRAPAERKVRTPKGKGKAKKPVQSELKNRRHYEDELRMKFGTRAKIIDRGGNGEVRFTFYSAEDRDRLLNELLGSSD